ncbi:MAG: DUF1732 domain-containing protein, partial [Rubrivivax sp.]|nr:DUF1732 domain-containing protein [Rubrivivax sp.]
MSVYSMTGYAGAAWAPADGVQGAASVSVELRSVNGRFLDLGLRLPDELRGLEPALRELLTASLRRGKVELRLSTQRDAEGAWPEPSDDQLARLMRLESTVRGHLPGAPALSVNEILNWCRGGAAPVRLDEAALDAARRCIAGLREAREREGAKLVTMLRERLQRLRELADQAEPLVPAIVLRQQQRFLERWSEAIASANTASAAAIPAAALQERALTEAASYAIRIDVAEELTRLRAHLDEIERLL